MDTMWPDFAVEWVAILFRIRRFRFPISLLQPFTANYVFFVGFFFNSADKYQASTWDLDTSSSLYILSDRFSCWPCYCMSVNRMNFWQRHCINCKWNKYMNFYNTPHVLLDTASSRFWSRHRNPGTHWLRNRLGGSLTLAVQTQNAPAENRNVVVQFVTSRFINICTLCSERDFTTVYCSDYHFRENVNSKKVSYTVLFVYTCICNEKEEESICIEFKSVPCLHTAATWWQCVRTTTKIVEIVKSLPRLRILFVVVTDKI
jgi:hypothetical protein